MSETSLRVLLGLRLKQKGNEARGKVAKKLVASCGVAFPDMPFVS